MAGRPTKLTAEVRGRLLAAIRVGADYGAACAYTGISRDTLHEWRRKGRAGRQPYSGFSDALKEAEGMAVLGWLAKIEKAANDGTWQAAAWLLERRYPERYGRLSGRYSI